MFRAAISSFLFVAVSLLVACGSNEPEAPEPPPGPVEIGAAVESTMERIATRDYAAIYDQASSEFRDANPKEDFLQKMQALETLGKLVDWEVKGESSRRSDNGAEIATVPVSTTYVLGEGPIDLTFRRDTNGAWRLDFYRYDVAATTYDPPYPASETGADRLAHRFMFLWQSRRYDDLAKIMPLDAESGEVRDFLAKMEPAGDLLTMKRKGFSSTRKSGTLTAKADYNLRFERGRGFIVFTLEQQGEEWAIDAIKYDVEYQTDPPN